METGLLRHRTFELEDGMYVLSLSGELDLATVAELRESVDGLPASRLVVDLQDVTFMDSAGLGLLTRAAKRIPVAIVTLNPHLLRFFSWTGADRRIAVHATLADAVAALR